MLSDQPLVFGRYFGPKVRKGSIEEKKEVRHRTSFPPTEAHRIQAPLFTVDSSKFFITPSSSSAARLTFATGFHHRRNSSSFSSSAQQQNERSSQAPAHETAAGLSAGRHHTSARAPPLPAIPATPTDPNMDRSWSPSPVGSPSWMSRSPSPLPGAGAGGWSSPGLNPSPPSPLPQYPTTPGSSGISWAAAKAKSDQVRSYPSFSTRNQGFFSRNKRRISASLPRFSLPQLSDFRGHHYNKHGPRTWKGRMMSVAGFLLRRSKLRLFLLLGFILFIAYYNYWTR